MIKLAINGANGRMGKTIRELATNEDEFKLVGLIERKGFEDSKANLAFSDSIAKLSEKPDVVIDFSTPEATMKLIGDAVRLRIPLVIGTTGFNDEQLDRIGYAARFTPILLSPNMSLGVNVLFKLTEEASKMLKGKGYDVEILEIHHRFKKDAPSGTAMKLAKIISRVLGKPLNEVLRFGRKGITGERPNDEIGMLSSRMGDTVGEHTVYFATTGERLELTHRATSRTTFAKGALTAARWIVGKKPKLYGMSDILGIQNV